MNRGYTYDVDERIAAHKTPLIGPYSSADRCTVQLQLELMRLSGVSGIIINWYGTQDANDYKVNREASDILIDECSRAGMLFTICYEDWTIRHDLKWGERPPAGAELDNARKQLLADFTYIRVHYMSRFGFLRAEARGTWGRPVILVFGPRRLKEADDWRRLVEVAFPAIRDRPLMLKLAARSDGFDGSFSWFPPLAEPSLGRVHQYLREYYERTRGEVRLGSVFPGFHDFYDEGSNGNIRSYGHLPEYDGHTFEASIEQARRNQPTFIQLCTWNDYQEGTVIEPTKERQNGSHFYYLLKLQRHIREREDEGALRRAVEHYRRAQHQRGELASLELDEKQVTTPELDEPVFCHNFHCHDCFASCHAKT